MSQRFKDKVVVITGATGALGRAVSAAFSAEGAKLVLFDRDAAALTKVYGAVTDRTRPQVVDLTDAASVKSAVDAAATAMGSVDVLCNIAGGFTMGEAVHETTDATWQLMFDTNARTVLNTVRAAVPHMQRKHSGKVVNVGAGAALKGGALMGAYAASKSVVLRLTESLSAELREGGINVNCVLPSTLDTPANRASMPDSDPARWVAPASLASVMLFLCSDQAADIHGVALPVSGLS